jgi:hypothetical protein
MPLQAQREEHVIVKEVRVHLHGGPEHGRELTAPTDNAGFPIPRLTVGARSGNPPVRAGRPPLLIYERDRQRTDGSWVYRYVGSEGRFGD